MEGLEARFEALLKIQEEQAAALQHITQESRASVQRLEQLERFTIESRVSATRIALAHLYVKAREKTMTDEEMEAYQSCEPPESSKEGEISTYPVASSPEAWGEEVCELFQRVFHSNGFEDITKIRNQQQHTVSASRLKDVLEMGPVPNHISEDTINLLKASFKLLFGVGLSEVEEDVFIRDDMKALAKFDRTRRVAAGEHPPQQPQGSKAAKKEARDSERIEQQAKKLAESRAKIRALEINVAALEALAATPQFVPRQYRKRQRVAVHDAVTFVVEFRSDN
ncbi:unnamed protein product [Sympodiomycopsis kandeliae]